MIVLQEHGHSPALPSAGGACAGLLGRGPAVGQDVISHFHGRTFTVYSAGVRRGFFWGTGKACKEVVS